MLFFKEVRPMGNFLLMLFKSIYFFLIHLFIIYIIQIVNKLKINLKKKNNYLINFFEKAGFHAREENIICWRRFEYGTRRKCNAI
jgi:hypothetical protein